MVRFMFTAMFPGKTSGANFDAATSGAFGVMSMVMSKLVRSTISVSPKRRMASRAAMGTPVGSVGSVKNGASAPVLVSNWPVPTQEGSIVIRPFGDIESLSEPHMQSVKISDPSMSSSCSSTVK
jgi:hypothetical protein